MIKLGELVGLHLTPDQQITELVNTRGYEIRAASSDGTVSFTGTMLNSDLTNVAITTESSPGKLEFSWKSISIIC